MFAQVFHLWCLVDCRGNVDLEHEEVRNGQDRPAGIEPRRIEGDEQDSPTRYEA